MDVFLDTAVADCDRWMFIFWRDLRRSGSSSFLMMLAFYYFMASYPDWTGFRHTETGSLCRVNGIFCAWSGRSA